MRASTIIALGAATLASASPIERAASGTFQVTEFSYGCGTTCDWSFDVAVSGNIGSDHPGFTVPVKCSGSTSTQKFTTASCAAVGTTSDSDQSVQAFITSNNQLRLRYVVSQGGSRQDYMYFGHTGVNATTSGKPQAQQFCVPETRTKVSS